MNTKSLFLKQETLAPGKPSLWQSECGQTVEHKSGATFKILSKSQWQTEEGINKLTLEIEPLNND